MTKLPLVRAETCMRPAACSAAALSVSGMKRTTLVAVARGSVTVVAGWLGSRATSPVQLSLPRPIRLTIAATCRGSPPPGGRPGKLLILASVESPGAVARSSAPLRFGTHLDALNVFPGRPGRQMDPGAMIPPGRSDQAFPVRVEGGRRTPDH